MSLLERLKPTHLPNTSDLAREAKEALAPVQKTEEEKLLDDPRAKPVYEFNINYTTARGKNYSGTFEVRIATIRDRDQIHLIQSRLRGGQPIESFSLLAVELQLMQAHLAVCLTKQPKWAENLGELYDFGVIQAIYEEVRSHEEYFLGWSKDKSRGASQHPDGDGSSEEVVE